ncbi:radical SAM protein [Alkalibacter mobilis]|uniref:radical SAM protein n=1 Tax=Alkalibacter mobilis TaxID=2787712 RepID=UPI001A9A960B|nr:radical SAM protein [Alkalibacter mobilis]
MKFVYGPVPSRRLGISLGISPIPKKTCNYSCIYCQLGRTDHMTNKRRMFYPVKEIVKEFEMTLKANIKFDAVTIVGEGEPTLYLGLGELIDEIKKRTDKPVAVITNGALFYDKKLRSELYCADIVLPTLDAYDADTFKRINRPHGSIDFKMVSSGLKLFSEEYQGQLWIELMLIDGINDDDSSLKKYSETLGELKYARLYINTPVRPPAEPYVKAVEREKMDHAVDVLGGISIDLLQSQGFHSEIENDYEAIISIIKRHPMNQFEIEGFLSSRDCKNIDAILCDLKKDSKVISLNYKGYDTYRLK